MNCPAFIAKSFAVRTATHLLHLASTSYAQHVALNEFYDALTPMVDSYAEICMGLEGRITKFPAVLLPGGKPEDVLEGYLLVVQDEMEEDAASQALLNVLAGIEEITARAIYKITNLK